MAGLDELFEQDSAPFDDLIDTNITEKTRAPDAALRNRASTLSILEGGDDAVGNYQQLMLDQENDETFKMAEDRVKSTEKNNSMKGMLSLLSDPSVSIETKQAAVEGFKYADIFRDSGTILAESALIEPSAGEDLDEEDSRVSTAEMLGEMEEERQFIQGIVNGIRMNHTDTGKSAFLQVADLILTPLGDGITAAQLSSNIGGSTLDVIEAFTLPGNEIASIRERLEKMTPSQRMEFATVLKDAISNSNDLLFTKDNDFVSLRLLDEIFGDTYDDTDKWVSNIFNILDIVGIGGVLRMATKTKKVGKALPGNVGQSEVTPPSTTPSIGGKFEETPFPQPMVRANARELDEAEAVYQGRIAEAGNTLDATEVRSLRDELETINARLSDRQSVRNAGDANRAVEYRNNLKGQKEAIEARLAANASAQKAANELPALEKRLSDLRKDEAMVPAALNPVMDAIQRTKMNSVIRAESPAAPANIFAHTNPDRFRNAHYAVFISGSDEVPQALFGASKVDTLAANTLPQISTVSGRVTTKVPDADKVIRQQMIADLDNIYSDLGGIQFTPEELASGRANIVNDFKQVTGLTVNDAMSSFSFDGGRVQIGAVYGTKNGGWSTSEEAITQAKYALRDYGVTDADLQILKKVGNDHVPVHPDKVAGQKGNFMVRVNMNRDIEAQDIGDYSHLSVKRNIFDFVPKITPESWGSLNQWVFDAASSLDKTITGSASVATDKSARLLKAMYSYADTFASDFNRLDKTRKAKLFDYFKEANFKGIAFDTTDLMARGFRTEEIKIASDWRNFWDGHYYLENLDVVRTLRSQEFKKFENANVDLFVREVPKNLGNSRVYDPASDTFRTLTKQEMDDLYNTGGTIAKLRRPENLGGEVAENMIVRNTPNEYARALRDNDTALNYRDGYYQITYKAPRFVEEVVRDSSGRVEYTRAVAIAGDTKEAEDFTRRLSATNGKEYRHRGDEKSIQRGSDAYWDLNSVSGRIAQRHRGKLLEDASGLNHLGKGQYIDNPVDSAIRAAQSVSGRTVMRPVIEAAKERFNRQYSHLITARDDYQRVKFPSNLQQIAVKGSVGGKELADARTTFNYIRYLEHGWTNAIDDTFKAAFNVLGDGLGKVGLSSMERGAKNVATSAGPSSIAKGGVFGAYIVANPLRQWIVQTQQVLRTFAYNPQAWVDGSMVKYASGYLSDVGGIKKATGDVKEFKDFMKSSGLLDAIDQSNLVRGTLLAAADRASTLGTVSNTLRRVGFDVGETGNLVGHAAAVFDKYKKAGKNVTSAEVRAEMHSEVRAISWGMNYAEDMPYNQNWAAVALQFMQVPHKAVLQITNRRIDRATRMRMVAADLALWGFPVAMVTGFVGDVLPDDPDLREFMLSGLTSLAMNNMLRTIADDNTRIDFSSLAPYEMDGWKDFFTALWSEGGISEVLANAPAVQLGGRIGEATKTMVNFFVPDDHLLEDKVSMFDVLDEVAKISSGWNNWQKGSLMLEIGKARDRFGRLTDEETTQFEAYAQRLGFGTADTRDFYDTNSKLIQGDKERKEKVTADIKEVMRLYQIMNPDDKEQVTRYQKVAQVILSKYKNDPQAQQIMSAEISRLLSTPGEQMIDKFLKAAQFPDPRNMKDTIRTAPLPDAVKEKLYGVIEDAMTIRQDNYFED